MCVSYQQLNWVTNLFEYPIGRCDTAIEDLGYSDGEVFFLCLDKTQGYHQIGVKKYDRSKLVFFSPGGRK